jgi:YesN/AraC family two-component response regulator
MSDSPKYRVLAVDDEPVVHRMLEAIIGACGLPVMLEGTASSGEDALALARKILPDICILDIHMEGMDGLELARRLSSISCISPKIIYLTAYDRFEYAQKAVHLGAVEYILKPIERDDLVAALGRAVNSLQAERLNRLDVEKMRRQLETVLPGALPPAETSAKSRNAEIADTVRSYIEQHYAENISLEKAASALCLSPGYLGPLFKSLCGLSFRAYLRSVRIARARELMADQSLNLSQIAQMCGYEDLNYFSQSFLKETGVRPSEYRGGGRRWAK